MDGRSTDLMSRTREDAKLTDQLGFRVATVDFVKHYLFQNSVKSSWELGIGAETLAEHVSTFLPVGMLLNIPVIRSPNQPLPLSRLSFRP